MLPGILAIVQPTMGEPVYLRCYFPDNKTEVMITADEANSAVSVALPSTGYSGKMAAAFTASEVRFQGTHVAYVLNRTDLTVIRTIRMINSSDSGKCAIEKAPKRAF
ncbi:MAG: hypothetical protein IIZ38_12195 [Sphingomonas sp.]|uniref:hypothetical protein n=1 Tax=Sphingomonas sp. TaxID=28214 RepID=UPI0025F6DE88|nr:hypothetical protein [Sphingomonas sp.]MBQ1499066.1 hypothetical protein [Sphingomonas sp.]